MSAWDPWWVHGDYADRHSMTAEVERRAEDLPFELKLDREDELIDEEDAYATDPDRNQAGSNEKQD